MHETHDEIEGDPRKLILDRCPLLRIFLDPYAKHDSDLWVDMLEKEMVSIRDAVIEVVGTKKANKELNAVYRDSEEFGIFAPKLERTSKAGLALSLILIGFELEDIEEAQMFLGDITDRLYEIGALNEDEVADPYDFVGEVLYSGMLLKEEVGNDVPEVWRKFIRTLEF